jgi:hypothetical protein
MGSRSIIQVTFFFYCVMIVSSSDLTFGESDCGLKYSAVIYTLLLPSCVDTNNYFDDREILERHYVQLQISDRIDPLLAKWALELIYLFGQKVFIDGFGRKLVKFLAVGEPHKVLCFGDHLSGKHALGFDVNTRPLTDVYTKALKLLYHLDP